MAELSREEEYSAYIGLAGRTIALLAALPKAEPAVRETRRMLAKNLCNFQERWATPLETPFEDIGSDLEERLETPRDWAALEALEVAFPSKEGHFFVNDATWTEKVATGVLSGSAAVGVTESFADWMGTLFEELRATPEAQVEEARLLAACWYYHATETAFEDEAEEEDAAATRVAAKTKTLIDQLLFGQDMPVPMEGGVEEEDDDDDDEYVLGEEEEDEEEDEEEEHDDEADLQEIVSPWVTREMELANRDESVRRKYANKHKQLGNNLFKEQEFQKSLQQFARAIHLLIELDEEEEESVDEEEAEEESKASEAKEEEEEEEERASCLSSAAKAELAILYGNRAAVFQKLGIWERVANDASKAIALNPLYTKALLRRAQAYEELEYFEEALEDFESVLGLAPDTNAARLAVHRLRILLTDDEEGGITADMMKGALNNMLKNAAAVRNERDQAALAKGEALPSAEMQYEESERARTIRELIIAVVGELGAHQPDVGAFPVHSQRMNEKRAAALASNSPLQLAWFPQASA